MAYTNNKLFYNSEDFVVKPLCNETMILVSDIDNSEVVVDLKLTNCFKPLYATACHKHKG